MSAHSTLRLVGASTALPEARETLSDARAADTLRGRPPDVEPDRRLPVADGIPLDLAAAAALAALHRGGISPNQVDELLYAWTHFQGHHFWSPAHALARQLGADNAFPVGIQQMCNGAGAALQLLARGAHSAEPRVSLIATGDVFTPPGFDRWSGDYGVLYGDAGTAVVVLTGDDDPEGTSATTPVSYLDAVATVALPDLESMHRPPGRSQMDPTKGWPVDIQSTKRMYLGRHGSESMALAMTGALRDVIPGVLHRAKRRGVDDITAVHLPRLEATTLASLYLPALAELNLPTVTPTVTTGHLGAGDLIANLTNIQQAVTDHDDTRSDLLISAGAGFTFTVAVVTTNCGDSS